MANGTDIAKAYVQIIPSTEGISGKLSEIMGGEADSAGKSAGSRFGGAFGTVLKAGGLAVAGFATATAAMTGALVNGAGDVAEYGDRIDKLSQKMGLSSTSFQEWDAIMQHSGTSIESMKSGMKTLANAVESGNGAFERIGLSMEEIAGMNNEELFAATISGLQNVENETERTYLAGQLLGRGATELGALLNTSAEETEAMRKRVHELGGVMSDEAVKAAAKYQDSLQDMKTAVSGLGRSMLTDFMPSLTTVMDGLTELFSGGDGMGKINEGINQLVGNISEAMPRFVEVGGGIINALLSAIVANLPQLIGAGFEAIKTLGQGIIDNLPQIVTAAFEILGSLAQGIIDSLPELIPTVVDVVIQIVETLIDNVDMLIDAAIEIELALANGLIDALPRLLEKAPEIIEKLVQAIIRNVPKLLEAAWEMIQTLAKGIVDNLGRIVEAGGKIISSVVNGVKNLISSVWSVGLDIVKGIWQGISNGLGWIKDKISGWVGNVMSFIKSLFGIKSPSTVMRDQVGKFLAQGIGVGFVDAMPGVERMMENAMPDLSKLTSSAVIDLGAARAAQMGRGAAYPGTQYNYGGVTIHIDGRGKDAETLAYELQDILTRRVAAYA